MAISLNSSPSSQYHFAYRPVVWTVSGNDATVVRCIADVYINGTYVSTYEKSPDLGETDVFTFDFQSVLQDNLKAFEPAFTASTAKMYADTNAGLYYNVRFFEILDNGTTYDTSWAADGAGTSYLDSASTYNPAFAYNSTLRHEETQDLSIYKTGGTYAGMHRLNKITTTFAAQNTNKARKIKRGDFAILSTWHSTASTIQGRINQYDSTPSNISNTNSTALASASRLWHYGVDTSTLLSNCDTFLQRIESTTPSAITDYCYWKVIENCNDYVSLYWQNDLGGIDYYLFRDGQVKTIQGESETYTKPLTTSFNTYDFGTTVLNKKGMTGVNAVSEVLDRTEADALSNLFTHGVRAWIYSNSQFIPVIIADGGIDTINTMEGIYRASIELVYSNDLIAQRF